ncbi:hypothetical protein MTOK_31670 [Mycolicibacterium tokaiense]|nr:hypothetical protein MTOK_31670 [Mycolicibacterium tokaiense]
MQASATGGAMSAGGELDLLDALYSAAADPDRWPAIITLLSDHVGAHGGMLVRNATEASASSCVVGRLCPEISALYLERYTDNPWTRAAEVVPIGEVAVLSDLYDLREGRHLPWYTDVLVASNIQEMAYLSLPGFTGPTSVGGLAFCFADTTHSAEAAHRLRDLRTHLQRAVWLSQQVDRSRMLDLRLDEMLHRSPGPVLLLSTTCRVVGMNRAAEALLREQSDLGVDRNGHLHADAPADDDALRAAARRAVNPGVDPCSGPLAVTINRPPRAPLRVLLTPLPQNHMLPALDPDAQAVALVTVVDPETVQRAKAAALSELYGLTTAEARVAVVLATGVGRVKVAEQLHVSLETVKKHTAACFRKVGVTTQAGLAYVVASVPSGLP